MQEREYMLEFFNRHTAEITAAIPAPRLLIYQVSDGWEPLCEFLDVPVPDADFPHINSRGETKAMLAALMAAGAGRLSEDAMVAAGRKLHGD